MFSLKMQLLLASFGKIARIASYLHIDWRRNSLAVPLSLQSLQSRHGPVSPSFVGGGIAL